MKEENNTEGLYYLKIDARHYFPDGKITRDVLEALPPQNTESSPHSGHRKRAERAEAAEGVANARNM